MFQVISYSSLFFKNLSSVFAVFSSLSLSRVLSSLNFCHTLGNVSRWTSLHHWLHFPALQCLLFTVSSVDFQRRHWHPTPILVPGKSHGRRSLVGCSPWGCQELDTTERLHFHFHALEREMATHCCVLAWRIPGTGEPGGLPSVGLHRVEHD